MLGAHGKICVCECVRGALNKNPRCPLTLAPHATDRGPITKKNVIPVKEAKPTIGIFRIGLGILQKTKMRARKRATA